MSEAESEAVRMIAFTIRCFAALDMNFQDVRFYLGENSSAYLFVRYMDAKVDELSFLAALTCKAVNLNPSNCLKYIQKQLEASFNRYHNELKEHSGSLELFAPSGDLPEGDL